MVALWCSCNGVPLESTVAKVSTAFPVMRHATANVPMETWREVPRKKYASTGKKAIYSPTTGGTPDNIAYAIPEKEKKENYLKIIKKKTKKTALYI